MTSLWRTLAAVLLLVLASVPLAAQSIRGVLVEEGTGRPIAAVVVVLLDGAQKTVHGTMTDGEGSFVLRAPAPGVYTLRADRIGYESTTTEGLELGEGQVLTYRMEVPIKAISLEGLTISAGKRCEDRRSRAQETARVWEEARKALAATVLVQAQRPFRFEILYFTRERESRTLRVVKETTRSQIGWHTQPFVSLPAEDLSEKGYVRRADAGGYDFFGPTAEVLLSDVFLDDHCLHLVDGSGGTEGMVGLAFKPVSGRNVPEIEGTFWLDRKTAALHVLEFRYTRVDAWITQESSGGRVEFDALPNGAWYVRSWWIRMPMNATQPKVGLSITGSLPARTAIREQGAEVARIITPGDRQPVDTGRPLPDTTQMPGRP